MANFSDFTRIKEIIKRKFLKDQELVNLMLNKGINITEFIDQPIGAKSPAKNLIKTYKFVPETIEDDKTYITMSSHVDYTNDDYVKRVSVELYVMCHKSQIETLQGNRHDLIADRVDKLLNGSLDFSEFGLGKFQLIAADEFIPIGDYYAWAISYYTLSGNREFKLRVE